MTDGELLDRFINERDDAAFEALMLRHGPGVLRVCRDVLPRCEDAEDAFQATFLVLVRNAHTIRDRDSVGRWLYEVAFRVSLRSKSQAARRRTQEREAAALDPPVVEFDPTGLELRPVLHAELNRLPERLRAPILLCDLGEMTQQEASKALNIPLGTLKWRLGQGRELLRSRLSRRGLTVSASLLLMILTRRATAEVPGDLAGYTVRAGMLLAKGKPIDQVVPRRVAALVGRGLWDGRGRRQWWLLIAAALLLAWTAGQRLLGPKSASGPDPAWMMAKAVGAAFGWSNPTTRLPTCH